MRWTPQQLRDYEQRQRVAKANTHRPAPGPVPQRPVRHEPLGTPQGEASHAAGYALRVFIYRQRLLDPDNACIKYFVDGLRYAGIIPNDTCGDIFLHPFIQKKVEKREEEKTVIQVERLFR